MKNRLFITVTFTFLTFSPVAEGTVTEETPVFPFMEDTFKKLPYHCDRFRVACYESLVPQELDIYKRHQHINESISKPFRGEFYNILTTLEAERKELKKIEKERELNKEKLEKCNQEINRLQEELNIQNIVLNKYLPLQKTSIEALREALIQLKSEYEHDINDMNEENKGKILEIQEDLAKITRNPIRLSFEQILANREKDQILKTLEEIDKKLEEPSDLENRLDNFRKNAELFAYMRMSLVDHPELKQAPSMAFADSINWIHTLKGLDPNLQTKTVRDWQFGLGWLEWPIPVRPELYKNLTTQQYRALVTLVKKNFTERLREDVHQVTKLKKILGDRELNFTPYNDEEVKLLKLLGVVPGKEETHVYKVDKSKKLEIEEKSLSHDNDLETKFMKLLKLVPGTQEDNELTYEVDNSEVKKWIFFKILDKYQRGSKKPSETGQVIIEAFLKDASLVGRTFGAMLSDFRPSWEPRYLLDRVTQKVQSNEDPTPEVMEIFRNILGRHLNLELFEKIDENFNKAEEKIRKSQLKDINKEKITLHDHATSDQEKGKNDSPQESAQEQTLKEPSNPSTTL